MQTSFFPASIGRDDNRRHSHQSKEGFFFQIGNIEERINLITFQKEGHGTDFHLFKVSDVDFLQSELLLKFFDDCIFPRL